MENGLVEIRAHVCEILAADRVMLAPVAAQLRADRGNIGEARQLLERLARMLNSHIDELEEHLRRVGGADSSRVCPAHTFPRIDVHTLARSLRGYYTALSAVHAAELMLETDARALGYSLTAAMATRQREEIAGTLAGIRKLLPAAVKEEIGYARLSD